MRLLLLLLLSPLALSAAAPVVSNVRAQQRLGTKLIDITYDLADSDGGPIFITCQLFAGTTPLPAFSLSGDIGTGVMPGTNKAIVWNAGQDWNRQYTTSGKVRIVADDLSVTPPVATMAYVPAGFTANTNGMHGSGSPGRVFTNGFFMDKTEVSKATWDAVVTWALANGYGFDNPGAATASDHPVLGVSWYDAVKWCNARSEMQGLSPVYYTDANRTTVYRTGVIILRSTFCNWSADGYRLPTRAEWSKALWGGSTSGNYYWPSYYGSGSEILNFSHGNFFTSQNQNSHPWDILTTGAVVSGNFGTTPCGYYNGTQTIGRLALGTSVSDMKNGFGLYDMLGNACEWLWDSSYSEVTATTEYLDDNYKGPDLGSGTMRYFASGRLEGPSDTQLATSATDAYVGDKAKFFWWDAGNTPPSYSLLTNGGFSYTGPHSVRTIGFRTVRSR